MLDHHIHERAQAWRSGGTSIVYRYGWALIPMLVGTLATWELTPILQHPILVAIFFMIIALSAGCLLSLVMEALRHRLTIFNIITAGRQAGVLREDEWRFHTLPDAMPLLIWQCNAEAKCDYFNQAWLQFTGRTMEQEAGDGWLQGVHPEEARRTMEEFLGAFERREAFQLEYRLRHHSGEYRWILDPGVPRFGPGGQFLGYVGGCIDITDRKRVEDALSESEARLKLAQQAGHVGVFDWDMIANRAVWSPELNDVFGLAPNEAEGTYENWVKYVHPEDLPRLSEVFQQCIRERRGRIDSEYRILRPDGQVRWVEVKGQISYLDDGRPVRIIGTIADLTERRRVEEALRQSETKFRVLAENARASFGIVQGQRFVYANPYFAEVSGYSVEELLTMSFPQLVHPESLPMMLEKARRRYDLGETAPGHYDFAMVTKSGEKRWVEFSVASIEYQGQPAMIGTGFDVAERKRVEEELHQANERLTSVNAALAEADRRKDEFLAMLAHELRNPLAPVRNAVQILHFRSGSDPAIQRQREIIDRQITHMAHLLDDLLDVSRVTRGKIVLVRQKLRLADVLAHAVETATPLAEARRHTLHVTFPPDDLRVEGDIDRLAQVFGNLLTNAVKYTDEGGQIWLEVRREDGQAVIRVRDTGMGIAPDMLPQVFDLFAQADQTLGRARGGLGIGLTMVKRLVEMHGGSVEVHSEGFGKGSAFTVRLPALAILPEPHPAPAQLAPHEEGRPTELRPRRILVVDDVVDTADSLAELLELWGYQVRTAHSGPAALDAARTFNPEVVLLDIGMPGMDGFEVTRHLRAEYGFSMVLVALTGYGQEEVRRQAEQAGFNQHLTKPVDVGALQSILERAA